MFGLKIIYLNIRYIIKNDAIINWPCDSKIMIHSYTVTIFHTILYLHWKACPTFDVIQFIMIYIELITLKEKIYHAQSVHWYKTNYY